LETPVHQPEIAIQPRGSAISGTLSRLVGHGGLIADEPSRRVFETDATTAHRSLPFLVILPQTTAEVSRVLKFCSENNIKVIARGAGTSLCAGAVPSEDAVVVGLSRMTRILDVNFADRTATVEAGLTGLSISKAVAAENFFYAPDPLSQPACTIGGNIATNAGGARSLKYGVTASNVLKVKMVLMSGEVVELGGDYLDPQGYDLLGLTFGSEGQLGIVTEVTVRILKRAEESISLLIAFGSPEEASACTADILAEGICPSALEFMDKAAIAHCEKAASAGYPLEAGALLILELEGTARAVGDEVGRIKEIAGRFEPQAFRASRDAAEAIAIWKGRKAAFAAIGQSGYHFLDPAIPLGKLPEVLKQIKELGEKYKLEIMSMCRAGDGNLQSVILYNAGDKREKMAAEECGAEILKLCVDAGGCLTAENGVGLTKRELMRHQFSEADLIQRMRVKAAFDPQWLLNPAKVFPPALRHRISPESAGNG